MKFLDIPRLSSLSAYFNNCTMGDRCLRGQVEAYSCKQAGDDKKLSKELEKIYQQELANSPPGSLENSPLGDFNELNTRKLLINLITTMNASFPDYDFSNLKPDQFQRDSLGVVINTVNMNLTEFLQASSETKGVLEELWQAIDETIQLKDTQVYSYISDVEGDLFAAPGKLWSFNYFFFNKTEKKILFLMVSCQRHCGNEYEDGIIDDDAMYDIGMESEVDDYAESQYDEFE